MPSDWTIDKRIVPYRVYWVIFFRPASPSFESRSSAGITTTSSCRMIEAEIYGMMPSAKTESRRRFPPEKRSTIPSSVFAAWSKNWLRA